MPPGSSGHRGEARDRVERKYRRHAEERRHQRRGDLHLRDEQKQRHRKRDSRPQEPRQNAAEPRRDEVAGGVGADAAQARRDHEAEDEIADREADRGKKETRSRIVGAAGQSDGEKAGKRACAGKAVEAAGSLAVGDVEVRRTAAVRVERGKHEEHERGADERERREARSGPNAVEQADGEQNDEEDSGKRHAGSKRRAHHADVSFRRPHTHPPHSTRLLTQE